MSEDEPREIYQNPLRHFLFHQIFNILKDGPAHGYQIMLNVEKNTGGCWRPSTAMVYKALSEMESVGHATSTEEKAGDRTRRVYSITLQGRREEERKEQAIASFINSIICPALEHGKNVPCLLLYGFFSPMGRSILENMAPEQRRIAIDQIKEKIRSDLEWLDTISEGEKGG